MKLPIGRDPVAAHTSAVDTLAAAGIEPPPGWVELRERMTATPSDTMLARYVAAVVDSDPDADLAALRAGALAEATAAPTDVAAVNNAVRAAVARRLRDLYTPVAETSYAQVAALFDAAAAKLAAAIAIVDPDADPAVVVGADNKTRQAWADCSIAAAELDRLLPALQAAAELCGVTTSSREALLALTVDPGALHRRRVWEAWDTTRGRAGRWAALLALGATVRACPAITALEPYRRPKPMEEHWERTGRGTHKRHIVDPEDRPAEPATT